MVLDRLGADAQLGRDLVVVEAARKKSQHLDLPFAHVGARHDRQLPGSDELKRGGDHRWLHPCRPGVNCANRTCELLDWRTLGKIAARTRANGAVHIGSIGGASEHHDADVRQRFKKTLDQRRREIAIGILRIEQCHGSSRASTHVDCTLEAPRIADHPNALSVQQLTQARAKQVMVIDEEYGRRRSKALPVRFGGKG